MLIDSSVWLEIFLDGKLREPCKRAIDSNSMVPVLVYYEVYKKLRVRFTESKALEAMGLVTQYRQVELSPEMALLAADLALQYDLGMADSLVLAQAKHLRVPLITLDNDFASIPGAKVLRG